MSVTNDEALQLLIYQACTNLHCRKMSSFCPKLWYSVLVFIRKLKSNTNRSWKSWQSSKATSPAPFHDRKSNWRSSLWLLRSMFIVIIPYCLLLDKSYVLTPEQADNLCIISKCQNLNYEPWDWVDSLFFKCISSFIYSLSFFPYLKKTTEQLNLKSV